MGIDICEWKEKMRGKIIRDVTMIQPGWFKTGYIEFFIEDPKTGEQFRSKLYIG